MTVVFATILVVHGLIHLLGFAKAFGLAALPQLRQPISPFLGVLWLIGALLFFAAAGRRLSALQAVRQRGMNQILRRASKADEEMVIVGIDNGTATRQVGQHTLGDGINKAGPGTSRNSRLGGAAGWATARWWVNRCSAHRRVRIGPDGERHGVIAKPAGTGCA
jgi:hypothetical protein